MKEQIALQKILLAKFEELHSKNPRFSRRSFSKRLGISAGAMSELFNGQRRVSPKLAERIAQRLGLDPQERAELFALFPVRRRPAATRAGALDQVDSNYLQLSADHFRVIGDWQHFAILSLMRTRGFKAEAEWIARRLGISVTVAQASLERLKRLELVQVGADGQLTRSKARYRTSDDVANVSVKRAHTQYLEKAREALDEFSVEARDFTSLMMSLEPSQLPRAKEMIRKFQDELSSELETSPGSEVYQLCMQLFPLSKNSASRNEGVRK